MSEHLKSTISNGVLYLTLNRPESLNAFSADMMDGLEQELNKAAAEKELKVVVLSGAGRSFSAGGDVKGMTDATPEGIYDHLVHMNKVIKAIKKVEKPVIAAVHGFAAGAGFNLAMACDLVLAAKSSKFALSFTQVGLMSDGGGSYFLPKLIGIHRAKELMFSGEPLSVEKAKEWGIVNQTFEDASMVEDVQQYAEKTAKGPVRAFGMMKKVMDHSLYANLEDILEEERISQSLLANSEDHKEGVQAFIEKRKPDFKGN